MLFHHGSWKVFSCWSLHDGIAASDGLYQQLMQILRIAYRRDVHPGFRLQQEAVLETLTKDVLKTSEIEDEKLDAEQA